MQTIIESLRDIVGQADFYDASSGYNGSWDYGAMIEYFCAVVLLSICVTSVFRFLSRLVGK